MLDTLMSSHSQLSWIEKIRRDIDTVCSHKNLVKDHHRHVLRGMPFSAWTFCSRRLNFIHTELLHTCNDQPHFVTRTGLGKWL